MIKAEIVADSKAPTGERLTTLLLTFPRIILAELNTHRILSKNSASSRAIPFKRMIEMVKTNPFIPIAWQKDHKGMQGVEYLGKTDSAIATSVWLQGRDAAVKYMETLNSDYHVNVSKQLCNRPLEAYMYHTVLISGTEWENFFELRCPQYEHNGHVQKGYDRQFSRSRKDWLAYETLGLEDVSCKTEVEWLLINKGQAEIHMMALAEAIWDAMNESKPKELKEGEWHIPYWDKVIDLELDNVTSLYNTPSPVIIENRIKVSTAFAARTSYTIVGDEKVVSYETLIKIHDRMAEAKPFHASPFEHCAKVMTNKEYRLNVKGQGTDLYGENGILINAEAEGWCRNFKGFIQYRHILETNGR